MKIIYVVKTVSDALRPMEYSVHSIWTTEELAERMVKECKSSIYSDAWISEEYLFDESDAEEIFG